VNTQNSVRMFACTALLFTLSVASSAQDPRKAIPPSKLRLTYQPLNVKTGLWQTTVTYKTSGAPPVSAGMLENLSPEQRARLEARMSATNANGRTETQKRCLTQEELQKPIDFTDKSCTWEIEESTSARARGNVSCSSSGITLNGTGTFEALDPEHVQGSQHMTSTGGGNAMTVDGTFTSTWLAANCGNVR
jgi:hypothetical protein